MKNTLLYFVSLLYIISPLASLEGEARIFWASLLIVITSCYLAQSEITRQTPISKKVIIHALCFLGCLIPQGVNIMAAWIDNMIFLFCYTNAVGWLIGLFLANIAPAAKVTKYIAGEICLCKQHAFISGRRFFIAKICILTSALRRLLFGQLNKNLMEKHILTSTLLSITNRFSSHENLWLWIILAVIIASFGYITMREWLTEAYSLHMWMSFGAVIVIALLGIILGRILDQDTEPLFSITVGIAIGLGLYKVFPYRISD